MSDFQLQVVTQQKCVLGECPTWDSEYQCIYWLDILKKQIHQYNTNNGKLTSINVSNYPGAIAFDTNGNLIVAMKGGFKRVDFSSGEETILAEVEKHIQNNRFNDGRCDPAGRFWAGTMSLSEEPEAGKVYCLNQDHTVSQKISNVTISNGMAWSADKSTFYYIDTPTSSVVSYDYNDFDGTIKSKKTIISVSESIGFPDGMAIDSDGMLWIAMWGGSKLTRWNPATGEMIYTVTLPVTQVTSCAFGGPDLNDIYITTASKGLTDQELADQPLAGALFVLKATSFKGLLPNRFKSSHT